MAHHTSIPQLITGHFFLVYFDFFALKLVLINTNFSTNFQISKILLAV